MNKYVISLSGGLDSTMLLCHILAQNPEAEIKAYSFRYGQKHEIELQKVQKNIEFLKSKGFKLTHEIIDLTQVFSDSVSTLHSKGAEIPKGDYDFENMKTTVVENRNVIFASIIFGKALSWAKRTQEEVKIALGVHAGDHEVYPDTTTESVTQLEKAFKISNWDSDKVNYYVPYINFSKKQVLEDGVKSLRILNLTKDQINYVLSNTHTCYEPQGEKACGQCGSCRERLEAFKELGLEDPAPYI